MSADLSGQRERLELAPDEIREALRGEVPSRRPATRLGCGPAALAIALLTVLAAGVPAPRAAAVIPSSGPSIWNHRGVAARDLSASFTAGEADQRQPGAPEVVVTGPVARAASATVHSPAGAPPLTERLDGWATWYDVGPGFYAAAGPELRAALGPAWRGELVEVVGPGRLSVVVELIDSCACGDRTRNGVTRPTIIDVSIEAFGELSPAPAGSAADPGYIRVSIEIPGAGVTLPPTDLPPHPDDERMRLEVRDDEVYR